MENENHRTEDTPKGKDGGRTGKKLIRITSKAGEMTFGKLLTSPMVSNAQPLLTLS